MISNEQTRYVLTKYEADQQRMGGKAFALAELAYLDVAIPEWFSLIPEAFIDSLSADQRTRYESGDVAKFVTSLEQSLTVADQVVEQMVEALTHFADDTYFAVRSSACDEDGVEHSFAGQFESYLYIRQLDILDHVKKVWLSGFSERVLLYRRERGLTGLPQVPSVLIQRMVLADKAGVAFAVDPISEKLSHAVVSAVFGLGSALVNGEASADTYVLEHEQIKEREVVVKDVWHHIVANQLVVADVPAHMQQMQVLTETEIVQVAQLARAASQFFGRFQDIEWAIENGKLYLLQSRPITSLGKQAPDSGTINLWDNSNIVESYGGITTPLTFSFIRRAYEEVYRQMCVLFRVSDRKVDDLDATFKRMLGLIKGRVYYNLLSWYRILAVLPGFALNRKFMEQMMGVKKQLPASFMAQFAPASWSQRSRDALDLTVSIGGLLKEFVKLEKRVRTFYGRLDEALQTRDLTLLPLDELAAYYLELEKKLLTKWDAPLVNDFFAMIFYGLLRSLSEKWCAEVPGLYNNLLCGDGDIISSKPAKRIKALATMAKGEAALVDVLCEGSLLRIEEQIAAHPAFRRELDAYIATFGDRCLEELKLESYTLHENPLPLYRSIGSFAKKLRDGDEWKAVDEEQLRAEAEREVRRILGGNLMKRGMFQFVLKHARRLVRNRENLRFERTRLFGRVRQIFLQMGMRLASYGRLAEARDIFYLEKDEILGYVDGTASSLQLVELVRVRKQEYENFAKEAAPDERFETYGPVFIGNLLLADEPQAAAEIDGDTMKGLGCCPGVVTGRVRIIRDPRGAELTQGEILVAERTDPGWIMLFPAAAGILVERGSLLSHSAIVAREMGIPAIVSLTGLTSWLRDGELVQFDGAKGIVQKLEEVSR